MGTSILSHVSTRNSLYYEMEAISCTTGTLIGSTVTAARCLYDFFRSFLWEIPALRLLKHKYLSQNLSYCILYCVHNIY